jgi:hypothetical protein
MNESKGIEMTTRRASFLTLFCMTGALCLTACGAGDEEATGDEADLTQGQCAVTNAQTGKALSTTARKAMDDPFFTMVLNAGGDKCANTVDLALAKVKAQAKQSDSVFAVSEEADVAAKTTGYRFVIAQPSATNKAEELFLSVLGEPTGLSQSFMEVMSFSKKLNAYVYYQMNGGRWTLKGDGTQIVPGEQKVECAACHTSGAPNMKELQLPWNNWNSFTFSMPSPMGQSPDFAALYGRKGGAESLEGIIVDGDKLWAKARVDAVLGGKRKGETLKSLLKQAMCEVGEPQIISSKSKHSARFDTVTPPASMNVPPSFLVSQLFTSAGEVGYSNVIGMSLGKVSSVSVKGSDYVAALTASGQNLDGRKGDTIFGMFVPERGFEDNMVVEELVRRNLLTKDTATDLLMADFTVPVFSSVRCALADTAPDAGADAEAVRTAWIKNLAASKLAGAAELSARLSDTNDFAKNQTAVDAFVSACATRATSDGPAFTKDLLKLASQRRKEFIDAYGPIVESPMLLPADTQSDAKPHAFRLNATTCKLDKQ